MRPRKYDIGLPRNVYRRHGAYYCVRDGRWYRLSRQRELVEEELAKLPTRMPSAKEQILAYCYRVLTRARQNARGRGKHSFTLGREDILAMLQRDGWRCAVTKTPFSMEVIAGKRPYAPSIDRIDSRRGYSPDNCRVVCVAANYAMNVWGEQVLKTMLRTMTNHG